VYPNYFDYTYPDHAMRRLMSIYLRICDCKLQFVTQNNIIMRYTYACNDIINNMRYRVVQVVYNIIICGILCVDPTFDQSLLSNFGDYPTYVCSAHMCVVQDLININISGAILKKCDLIMLECLYIFYCCISF